MDLFAGGGGVTPVELSIDAELIVEEQRFHNAWLFKWYGMTYEGGKTDVEDFRGGRIHFAGIKFGDQQQSIYWHAIDRYLRQKMHAVFKQWDTETQGYPLATRRKSIDGVERALGRFVARVLSDAVETDRRLRGKGHPQNVAPYVPSPGRGSVGGEVAYLAAAHRALVDQAIAANEPKPVTALSRKQRVEEFLSSHKGIMAAIGLLIGIIGLAKYFHG
jgi:hypothetical protein